MPTHEKSTNKTKDKSKDSDHGVSKIRRRGKEAPPASVQSTLPLNTFTEEDEVDRRNCDEDLTLQRASCQEIRNAVQKIAAMKRSNVPTSASDREQIRVHGLMQFVALKKLNRLSHIRSKKAKDATNIAKIRIDQHNLQLQNLLYEVMHLQKEIDKCLQFKSKDEDLNLISAEEFYQDDSHSGDKEELQSDAHKEMLARLDWELQQRKGLSEKLKNVSAERKNICKEIDQKKETVDNLLPQLQTILEATLPVQEYLGIPLERTREQHTTAKYLPNPLYVLYRQITGFRDACDSDLEVNIIGDIESAKALYLPASDEEADDSGESDQEETEKSTKRSRRTSENLKKQMKLDKTLRTHPLSINLKVICKKEQCTVDLTFFYLVAMEIVSVIVAWQPSETSQTPTAISASDILSSSNLLCCLYTGDNGQNSPNPANSYLQQKIGMEDFTSFFTKIGYPYNWAQNLAGLQFLTQRMPGSSDNLQKDGEEASTSQKSTLNPTTHTKQTIKLIRKRVRARISLTNQFLALEKGDISVAPEYQYLFTGKISTHLSSWVSSVYDDYITVPYNKQIVDLHLAQIDAMYFVAVMQRNSVRITVQVMIDADYPSVAPIMTICVAHKHLQRTALNDSHIRDLEAEVNIYYDELCYAENQTRDSIPSCVQLLTNQLQRLAMCLDIYLESEYGENAKEKMYYRPCRGPQRCKPYKFDNRRGFFVHR